VWRDGLNAFSVWAVWDNVAPNAVALRGFTAQAGGGFPGAAAWAALIGVGLWAAFRRRHPAPAGQAGGAAVRTAGSPVSRPAATAYAPPAVVHETALEVRAGSPLGVPLLPDWPDPAGLQK
jgi:hypothetical protein